MNQCVYVLWFFLFRRLTHNAFVEQIVKKKKRVVINIRDLNKISQFDVYSMQQQIDIIATIMKCSYIFLINATTFFHQWLIKLTNRHKLIVIFHRNNEQWNVMIMKYRNFSTYVQRQINIILRKYKHFAKTYVNDIVVFLNFLKKHFRHFNMILVLLKKYNIVIKIFKIYLDYFSISLLKQRVDNFDFTTTKKKLKLFANWDSLVRLNISKRI